MHLGRALSILALAVSAALPVLGQTPNNDNAVTNPVGGEIPADKDLKITWTATKKADKVSIILVRGPPGDLSETVLTIASNQVNNGEFTWAPPGTLSGLQVMGDKQYAIKILDETANTFSVGAPFKLNSPNGAPLPPVAGASSAASTRAAGSTKAGETHPATKSAPSAITPTTPPTTASTPTTAPPASTTTPPSPTKESTSLVASSSTLESSIASSATESSAVSSETPSSTSSASSSATDSASKETSSSTTSASAVPSKGLKTPAVVGIAAAIVVLVVGIVIGVILFLRRKRVDRESKMFGGAADPNYLRNSGYKPQTSYDSEFAMMERQRPYGEFRETGPYSSQSEQPVGIARF